MDSVGHPPPVRRHRTTSLLLIPVLSTAFGAVAGIAIDASVAVAIFGLIWSLPVLAVARRAANLGARSASWANAPIFLGALISGIELGGALLAHTMVGTSPQALSVLLREPFGGGYGLFFFSTNFMLEWVVVPADLILSWHHPPRRSLLVGAALIYYVMRMWSAVYFSPAAQGWGDIPADVPFSPAQLDAVLQWITLDLIRTPLQDLMLASVFVLVALVPAIGRSKAALAMTPNRARAA